MINVKTGEFKLDDYKLIIDSNLSLSQFKAGDIPISCSRISGGLGWCLCWFDGNIDGLQAKFSVQFQYERIQQLFFEPLSSGEVSEEGLRRRVDNWLANVIGRLPPYIYDWGLISPAEMDPRSGSLAVAITFKNYVLGMGFNDVKSFHEYQQIQRPPR